MMEANEFISKIKASVSILKGQFKDLIGIMIGKESQINQT